MDTLLVYANTDNVKHFKHFKKCKTFGCTGVLNDLNNISNLYNTILIFDDRLDGCIPSGVLCDECSDEYTTCESCNGLRCSDYFESVKPSSYDEENLCVCYDCFEKLPSCLYCEEKTTRGISGSGYGDYCDYSCLECYENEHTMYCDDCSDLFNTDDCICEDYSGVFRCDGCADDYRNDTFGGVDVCAYHCDCNRCHLVRYGVRNYKKGVVYVGAEIEVDGTANDSTGAYNLIKWLHCNKINYTIQKDGSLYDGIEIILEPLPFGFLWRNRFKINSLVYGVKTYAGSGSAGLHLNIMCSALDDMTFVQRSETLQKIKNTVVKSKQRRAGCSYGSIKNTVDVYEKFSIVHYKGGGLVEFRAWDGIGSDDQTLAAALKALKTWIHKTGVEMYKYNRTVKNV